MKALRYLCGVLLVGNAGLSIASGDITYESLPALKPPAQIESGINYSLVEKPHQTIIGLTLLETPFSEITKRFGTSALVPISGFTHGEGVCVAAANHNDSTRLLFVTIPVAGFHAFVLLSKASKIKTPAGCISSFEINKDLMTQSGIHLGMKREEVIRIFGKPFRHTAGSLHYRFEIKKKFTPKQWFDEFRSQNKDVDPQNLYTDVRTDVKIEFVNDEMVSYSISTTDTY